MTILITGGDKPLGGWTCEEEDIPYCSECGCEELAFGDRKANGTEAKCRGCGHEFLVDSLLL